MHFNLHKTFRYASRRRWSGFRSGGGQKRLAPFLPVPIVVKDGETYHSTDRPESEAR